MPELRLYPSPHTLPFTLYKSIYNKPRSSIAFAILISFSEFSHNNKKTTKIKEAFSVF